MSQGSPRTGHGSPAPHSRRAGCRQSSSPQRRFIPCYILSLPSSAHGRQMGAERPEPRGPRKADCPEGIIGTTGKELARSPKLLGWFEDKDKDPQRCTWGWGRIAITLFILMPHLTPQRMCGHYINTCPIRYNECLRKSEGKEGWTGPLHQGLDTMCRSELPSSQSKKE